MSRESHAQFAAMVTVLVVGSMWGFVVGIMWFGAAMLGGLIAVVLLWIVAHRSLTRLEREWDEQLERLREDDP